MLYTCIIQIFDYKQYYYYMGYNKILFLISLILLVSPGVKAEDIQIYNFEELINSNPASGDVFEFNNNLDSDASIGNHFFNLDLTFEGNHHYLDGNNTFSGFILNQDSLFNEIEIQNCKGQEYQGSDFAGAVFNFNGHMDIQNSGFTQNFVEASGFDYAIGGAAYNLNSGVINIDSANFNGNYAHGALSAGGAIANGFSTSDNPDMSINNSVFENNDTAASVTSEGGALYNKGTIDINNSVFKDNYATTEDDPLSFVYGGAISNAGNMTINNTSITGNHAEGKGSQSAVLGGAIYNSANLTVNNSTLNGNYADSPFYAEGGAIYNDVNGTTTIKNSVIENNRVSSQAQFSEGGAIYNAGRLIVEGSTFKSNLDKDGELNDIYNTGTVEFTSSSTTNIESGIRGTGNIIKQGSGTLNLGGENSKYTGNFNFEGGTVKLLSDSTYFNAANTAFGNNINFDMQNGQINNINFGNLSLSGQANVYADVNFNNNTMDRINAASISGNGDINVANLLFEGTPEAQFITIPFADSVLKDYVHYATSTIYTPMYNYSASYDSGNGNFNFVREGFNSSLFVPAVAAQLAGYAAELETYKNVFSNLDMVMINPPNTRINLNLDNKTASISGPFMFSPLSFPEQRNGIWIKPYTLFEKVPLKNGPDVSNVSYGTIIGGESGLRRLKKGWYNLYGAYVTYNGSHQAFEGNSIHNNGGIAGVDTAFYKGNFFSLWTANAGASSAEATTAFGRDNFAMFNTGIAEKTGYNFQTFERRLIIQPSLLMSYTFVNTFDYTNAANVQINSDPLHAIHIEPQIKFIGNFKNYLQPYISVSMIWNIIDDTKFKANDVYLPELSIKPYVQYGVGVQKRWGDRLTGFLEAMIRNGGRNGIALLFGLRISI